METGKACNHHSWSEQIWIPGVIVAHLIATLYLQWKGSKSRGDIKRPQRIRESCLKINAETKTMTAFLLHIIWKIITFKIKNCWVLSWNLQKKSFVMKQLF